MNRLSASLLTLLSAAFVISGCASSGARVAHLRGTTPVSHSYRTYALVEHPVNADEGDSGIAEAIAEQMRSLGYEASNADVADVHVQYGLLLDREEIEQPIAPNSGNTQVDLIAADIEGGESSRKVLLIIMDERQSNRIVWLGVSSTDVTDDQLGPATRRAVGEVLERFPVAGEWGR